MPLNDVAVLLREKEGGPGGGGAGCMVEAMRPCDVRTQPRRDILESSVAVPVHPALGQSHSPERRKQNTG